MKYRIAIPALICAALWTIGFGQAQEAEPKCLLQNGNTNGDDFLDLSDAIYLLNFLYIDDSEPKPQYVADVQCVTTLGEELAVAKSDLAKSQQALAEAQASLTACASDLEATRAERDAANQQIATLNADLAASQAALESCRNAPRLSATGQTKCYDAAGSEIPCDDRAGILCIRAEQGLLHAGVHGERGLC